MELKDLPKYLLKKNQKCIITITVCNTPDPWIRKAKTGYEEFWTKEKINHPFLRMIKNCIPTKIYGKDYQNAIWDWEMYHTDDEGIL